jgi:hypothetical protein
MPAKRDTTNDSMYSGVPCNECGGPTLRLTSGSIWCSAEDPHPGGHFVTRVAFERTPAKQAAYEARGGKPATPIKSRGIKPQTSAIPSNLSEPAPTLGSGGYDDFVKGSK